MKKRQVREAKDVGDAMKSSEENVTLDSKRELDEMKSVEVRTCFVNLFSFRWLCCWKLWLVAEKMF